ncbi:MAG TPA: hypothetical protein PK307_09635 [Spirochaetota bacterium]|nr:hypothetical protein [Spirochaetota bacterium]HOD13633.1 hypothetical protein [Spirochaetota bacterium]HPN11655.1 hypothetical protein [Spirochaetota bacterium]HQL82451.1 hypothetical protein [Spirochaetota bacterium]
MAHICPWWAGFILVHPLRKIKQDPHRILSPYVREGMVVADAGPEWVFSASRWRA